MRPGPLAKEREGGGRPKKEYRIKLHATTIDYLYTALQQFQIIAAKKHQLADG